jgi:hypothetical protein
MRTWPVGCGPTLKKIRRFPDYEQPFELTDEQIREKFYVDWGFCKSRKQI